MVIDVVHSGIEINGEKTFFGLYNVVVPKRCWASANRLLLSTNQKNEIKTYVVDIGNNFINRYICSYSLALILDSGDLTELEFEVGSQTILDVFEDTILLNRQNFLVPDKLVIGKLPDKGEEASVELIDISVPLLLPEFEGFTYHYMELTAPDAGEEISNLHFKSTRSCPQHFVLFQGLSIPFTSVLKVAMTKKYLLSFILMMDHTIHL